MDLNNSQGNVDLIINVSDMLLPSGWSFGEGKQRDSEREEREKSHMCHLVSPQNYKSQRNSRFTPFLNH